jgi:hypothetical protein
VSEGRHRNHGGAVPEAEGNVRQGRRRLPDPILKLTWAYNQPTKPSPEELLREINGKALADVLDPKDPTKVLVKAGEQLPASRMLRDDGSTACGNWIYCGCGRRPATSRRGATTAIRPASARR